MKTTNKILALAFMAVAMVFTSCSKDDDNDPVVPTQQEIETKIIGKWKNVGKDGKDLLTNDRAVFTYYLGGLSYSSLSKYNEDLSLYVWMNCEPMTYNITGNELTLLHEDMGMTTYSNIYAITDVHFVQHVFKICDGSKEVETDLTFIHKKVTADYSQDIIGLWEGVEMTGYETYGNIEARIEYKADGTYIYYKKVDGEWQPLADVIDEYNVDGDWLATRWQNKGSDVMNYEWWDIDYIKKEGNDIIMKWSALREKEDGERFTTTFTWKKVENKG